MPEHNGVRWWVVSNVLQDDGSWVATVQFSTGSRLVLTVPSLPGTIVDEAIRLGAEARIDRAYGYRPGSKRA